MEILVSIKPLFDDFRTKFQKKGTNGSYVTQQLSTASEGSYGEAAEEGMFFQQGRTRTDQFNVDDVSLPTGNRGLQDHARSQSGHAS